MLFDPSKRFALRMATMIDSRLIWYKHYFDWADEAIASLPAPLRWVLEIATTKYYPRAVAAIGEFLSSEPLEPIDATTADDEYIACLFLRYRRRELSWATFLDLAGSRVDSSGASVECEYFYERLTQLEDAEFSPTLENRQAAEVAEQFQMHIAIIEPIYTEFLRYFRRYVSGNASTEASSNRKQERH